jgi:hypothetical protein
MSATDPWVSDEEAQAIQELSRVYVEFQMMTRLEAIELLHEHGCLYVTTGHTGSEVYYAAQALVPQRHWPLSGWAILGQLDGNEWCVCNTCREIKMIAPRKIKCSSTRACTGTMERIAPRPRLTKKVRELIFQ